jgi:DsbC/DsbD-like thiol-disulfide interchange protein
MKNSSLPALAMAFLLLGGGYANSAATDWSTVEGGAVRVVVSANPDENGNLRGALQVDLEPGWKTYWLDPGDAGVPPTVAVSTNSVPGEVQIGFPPPERYDDGYAVWAGYDRPVSLALTITPPETPGPMEFYVFLGVCETICIPVQSTFSLEPDRNVANSEHEAIVENAFSDLPQPARAGFRVVAVRAEGENLVIEAETPAGAPTDLFLASTENRMFGTPRPEIQGGRVAFRVPILSVAADVTEKASYTLVSGGHAVTGTVTVGD